MEASLPRDLSYRLLPKQEGPVPALLQNRPLGSQLAGGMTGSQRVDDARDKDQFELGDQLRGV